MNSFRAKCLLYVHYGLQSQIGLLNSKKKIFLFFLIKITISIWGKVIFVQNRLEQAILGPLRAPKLSKMAILGSFSQFDAHLAIFLAGTRWNSPLKVKIEAMSMSMPSKKTL